MNEKQVTIEKDTAALVTEIVMNIWTALDLHTAGLKTNGETLSEIKALAEELHVAMTEEAQSNKNGERYILLTE